MSGTFWVCAEPMCGICANVTPIINIADKSLFVSPLLDREKPEACTLVWMTSSSTRVICVSPSTVSNRGAACHNRLREWCKSSASSSLLSCPEDACRSRTCVRIESPMITVPPNIWRFRQTTGPTRGHNNLCSIELHVGAPILTKNQRGTDMNKRVVQRSGKTENLNISNCLEARVT